jgi:hypothetical protein
MSDVTLYVGVRWFRASGPGRLDIDVDIDGTSVTAGETFPTPDARKKPDSFVVELPPGRHRLRASSRSRKARFEADFEVTRDRHYAQLCYNHYPAESPGPDEGFEFEIQDRDFGWR